MLTVSAPHLVPAANPLLAPARSVPGLEREMNALPHLQQDLRHSRRVQKTLLREARQAKTAAEAIGQLPEPDEALHMMISGRFALWDFVPAILSISDATIDRLTLVSLGFSRRNVISMCEHVDAGRIKRLRMLFSHYFRGTSTELTDFADEEFGKRPEAMELLSLRTHAKMILAALSDGRCFVIESSANLRSCKNIEQATMLAAPDVYAFHVGWIDGLFAEAKGA